MVQSVGGHVDYSTLSLIDLPHNFIWHSHLQPPQILSSANGIRDGATDRSFCYFYHVLHLAFRLPSWHYLARIDILLNDSHNGHALVHYSHSTALVGSGFNPVNSGAPL